MFTLNRNKLAARRPRESRMRIGIVAWVFMACICGIAFAQPKAVAPAPAPAAGGAAAVAAPTGPADAIAEPAPTKADDESAFQMFQKGGPAMYALLIASIIAVTVIIERFIALRRSAVVPPGFLPGLQSVYRDRDRDRAAAIDYCESNNSSLSRMVAAGLRKIPRGHAAVEKAIEDAGANEALKLRKNLRILYAIGSVATLLGLIGTISGMIKAFRVASGGGLGKSELLAKGIYEAMVCTFGGLAVAILVTVFYYYFVGRVENLVSDMNDEIGAFDTAYTDTMPFDEDTASSTGGTTSSIQTPLPEFALGR